MTRRRPRLATKIVNSSRETRATVVAVFSFVIFLLGSNIIVEITSLRAFVTFFFSAFIAAYIGDKLDE